MTNKDGLGWVLWWCLVLSAVPVAADQLAVGDRLPALTLHDQHDQTTAIAEDTRLLLVAVEKPAADLVTAFLEEQPAGFLQRNAAVYLMDISAMPKMITRMFALPKMQTLWLFCRGIRIKSPSSDWIRAAWKGWISWPMNRGSARFFDLPAIGHSYLLTKNHFWRET